MRGFLALLVLLAAAPPAMAQGTPNPIRRPAPDFLFEKPRGSVTVRGSWLFSRGQSDWYDFVTTQLTLQPRDFNAPGFGVDVNVPISSRFEGQFAFDISRSSQLSEYRAFVDNNRLPIEQTTTLREINLGGNIRYLPLGRGSAVSRLAWVPRKVVPFVGGGAGVINYDLQQVGDFVDFVDFSVFADSFDSHGWAPSAQVFAGADIRVLKRMYVTIDGRYLWAADELGLDWVNFAPIDLAGFKLSAGVSFSY
jgi:opacity protein-like surface antigen